MTKQTNRKQSRASFEVVAPYKGFVKVERDFLDHPMFRGHMDWLGAWILVLAAADYRDKRVNLTNVGRKAASDFNWDNAKWRRFTKRLEKEGLLATVEKRNLGDKLGYKHIALVLDKTSHSAESRTDGANTGPKTVRNSVGDG